MTMTTINAADMQKIILQSVFSIILLLTVVIYLPAQRTATHPVCLNLPEFAIIDIEPNNLPIQLSMTAPVESGQPITIDGENKTKWLNYTSAIPDNGLSRTITAQISSGTLSEGVELYLGAGNYQGNGAGNHGTPGGNISLNENPQVLISDIGRGFTGNGLYNGHLLTYGLNILDYDKLNAQINNQVVVIFTIVD